MFQELRHVILQKSGAIRAEVSAVGRVVYYATEKGAVQIRLRDDGANVILGKSSSDTSRVGCSGLFLKFFCNICCAHGVLSCCKSK